MSLIRLQYFKFVALTLIVVLLCLQFSVSFADRSDDYTNAVPNFWEQPNPFYEYIENRGLYGSQISGVIEANCVIPNNIKHLFELPLYHYVYIVKKPTLNEDGIGLIEMANSSGQKKRTPVKIRKLTEKQFPAMKTKMIIDHAADTIKDGKPSSVIMVKMYAEAEHWEELTNHMEVLDILFYAPSEIAEASLQSEQKPDSKPKTTTVKYANSYFFHARHEYIVPKMLSEKQVRSEDRFRMAFHLKSKYSSVAVPLGEENKSVYSVSSEYPHRPPWVKFEHQREMLETMPFVCRDETVFADRQVYVDYRKLSEKEQEQFFNGTYFFELKEKDTIHSITIVYTAANGSVSKFTDHVICYTLKPRVDIDIAGKSKVNHRISASPNHYLSSFARSVSSLRTDLHADFTKMDCFRKEYEAVTNTAPGSSNPAGAGSNASTGTNAGGISGTTAHGGSGNVAQSSGGLAQGGGGVSTGADVTPKILRSQDDLIEMICPAPGKITFHATVRNNVSSSFVKRTVPSDYFTATDADSSCIVIPDAPPALILMMMNHAISRTDELKYYSDAVSVDGESIKKSEVRLFSIGEHGEEEIGIPNNKRLPLGKYVLTLTAEEESESVSPRKNSVRTEFSVDNYAPVSKMSLKTSERLPAADIVIVTDHPEHSRLISEHQIELTNFLREKGFDAVINHWDHTKYTYHEEIHFSDRTGSSYPSSTYHYSVGGYRGVLDLINVSNQMKQVDRGAYVDAPKSHTVSEDAVNTSSSDAVFEWRKGRWHAIRSWNGTHLPNVKQIQCPHGHGKITGHKQPGVYGGNRPLVPTHKGYEGERYYVPYIFYTSYVGVCSYKERVWEPKYEYEDQYTGHYAGTVTKTVQKPYEPNYRHLSDKITCYYKTSGVYDSVSNSSDQREVSFQGEIGELKEFLLANLAQEELPSHTVIVNEAAEILSEYSDYEHDPVEIESVKIEHHPEAFDHPGTNMSATAVRLPNTFTQPGIYTITKTIRDLPPNRAYSKKSESGIVIHAHRPPICKFELQTAFKQDRYLISFEDLSYDPDFASRADKGIVGRIFRYRKDGGNWIYKMPKELPLGEYVFSYAVQDRYGVWSKEETKTLNLSKIPKIEISAKHRGTGFDANAIPAGESIEIYDIRTKYHDRHNIEIRLLGNTEKLPFSSATQKAGDQYEWRRAILNIPENTKDGTYEVEVEGISETDSAYNKKISLSITVNTPVRIDARIEQGDRLILEANSNSYVDRVIATLFVGTPYEQRIALTRIGQDAESNGTLWRKEIDYDAFSVPDGIYTTSFTAYTASGKELTVQNTREFQFLKIKTVSIKGEWDHWKTDRFMGYEKIKGGIELSEKADEVLIRFSPELENMNYRNANGVTYSYLKEFGYTVRFPIRAIRKGDSNIWEFEYILPIAKSTMDWNDRRIREPYRMIVTATKGRHSVQREELLDMTGNVHDLLYLRPVR